MTLVEQVKKLREKQIAHIRSEQAKFDAHQCGHRDVAEYFGEYWDAAEPDALYVALCNDLGLNPKKEALDL